MSTEIGKVQHNPNQWGMGMWQGSKLSLEDMEEMGGGTTPV
jgi:hypothetical protein